MIRSVCLRSLLWLLLVVVAAACAPFGPGADGASEAPSHSRDDRIAVVRALRTVLAQPAAGLGATVDRVAVAFEELRRDPPRQPVDRLEATDVIREDHVPALDDDVSAARDVELAGDTVDAQATRDAWSAVLTAAQDAREAALVEVRALDRAAEIDQELASLTRRWDEPGSRSQQLAAFDEVAARAEELAQEVAAIEPVAACMTTFERRAAAAETVAERTVELRDLVARYRGDEFDELRSEYRQDPYGLGAPLGEGDADDFDCWESSGPVVVGRRAVHDALEGLERVLNPADLR